MCSATQCHGVREDVQSVDLELLRDDIGTAGRDCRFTVQQHRYVKVPHRGFPQTVNCMHEYYSEDIMPCIRQYRRYGAFKRAKLA